MRISKKLVSKIIHNVNKTETGMMAELTHKVLLFWFQIEQTVPTKNLINGSCFLEVEKHHWVQITLVQQLRMLLQNSTQITTIAIQIPPRWEWLGMKQLIAAAMLNFKAHSSQAARILLTGSLPGLLDLWNYKLDIYYIPSTKLWRQGKNCIPYKYKKLDIKARDLIYKYVLSLTKKLATDNNVINLM